MGNLQFRKDMVQSCNMMELPTSKMHILMDTSVRNRMDTIVRNHEQANTVHRVMITVPATTA